MGTEELNGGPSMPMKAQ